MTILCVRKGGKVAMAGDGLLTQGNCKVKPTTMKIRMLGNGQHKVICGFAGVKTDCLALLERLETKLVAYPGQLMKAAKELAKEDREHKGTCQPNATLLLADGDKTLQLTGAGEYAEAVDQVCGIGSGGAFAAAAARALLGSGASLTARAIVHKSVSIAQSMDTGSNDAFHVEEVPSKHSENGGGKWSSSPASDDSSDADADAPVDKKSKKSKKLVPMRSSLLKKRQQKCRALVIKASLESPAKVCSLKKRLHEDPFANSVSHLVTMFENDCTNRYQCAKSTDEKAFAKKTGHLLLSERRFCQYFGRKYGLGVSSGGLAIFLGLKALQRVHMPTVTDSKDVLVYSNSFTFNAVPSAIVNAGMTPVLCETTPLLTVDLQDLERRIVQDKAKGCGGRQILCLSFMRARIPDMDEVMRICSEHKVLLLEDNAHGYGTYWKGRPLGSFGLCSTISTQSNKLINTGEGGFIFTDCPHLQSYFMMSAGCYEERYLKHEELCPPLDVLENYRFNTPNFSCRMSNVLAALVNAQMDVLQERIDSHNRGYYVLEEIITKELGPTALQFIPQLPEVTPVWDSLQIRLLGGHVATEQEPFPTEELPQTRKFCEVLNSLKYSIQIFFHKENARNYKSWDYVKVGHSLDQTDYNLKNVLDMRLSCTDTDEDIKKMADDICSAYRTAMAEGAEMTAR